MVLTMFTTNPTPIHPRCAWTPGPRVMGDRQPAAAKAGHVERWRLGRAARGQGPRAATAPSMWRPGHVAGESQLRGTLVVRVHDVVFVLRRVRRGETVVINRLNNHLPAVAGGRAGHSFAFNWCLAAHASAAARSSSTNCVLISQHACRHDCSGLQLDLPIAINPFGWIRRRSRTARLLSHDASGPDCRRHESAKF